MALRPVICLAAKTRGIRTALLQKCSELNIKEVSDSTSPGALEEIRKCDILISYPEVIVEVMQNPGNLKWIYNTWAGVEKISSKCKKTPSVTVTRNGIGYGQIMGEYVIGQILAREKQFKKLFEDQGKNHWANEIEAHHIRPLTALTIGVLGVGQIGSEVCRMCRCMGMTVWGLTRSPVTPENRSSYVNQYRLLSELPELLSACDYVCNILPQTPETIGLLNNDMLQNCQPKKSVFMNVGRGSVISEEELLKALRNGWIGGAVLDVFEKEPLPQDSPLWSETNVVITPHCAGMTTADNAAECFILEYERFIKGEELLWKCDFERGY